MKNPEDKLDISNFSPKEGVTDADIAAKISFEGVVGDIANLATMLIEETELLKDMKVKEVGERYEEKMKLIRRLEIQNNFISKNPAVIQDKKPEDIEDFIRVGGMIDQIVRENFNEVLKAKEVNQRVVEAVSQELAKHEVRATGYKNDGTEGNGVTRKGKEAPFVAVNETI